MNELIQKMNVACFLKVRQLKHDSISLDIIDLNFNIYYYHPLSKKQENLYGDMFFLTNLFIDNFISDLKLFFNNFHFFFQIILFMNIFLPEFS
jgi:hypothetical protein